MQQKPSLSISARTFLGHVWQLSRPYWFSEERWIARGLLAAVVVLNLGTVYITVQVTEWQRLFFNALQDKNFPEFTQQLLRFSVLAAIFILIAVYQLYLNQMLQIRWRRWLTEVYLRDWLSDRVYYRLELKDYGTDNPDQRIAQDLQIFAGSSLSLTLGLLNSVVTLISFIAILWLLSGSLTVTVLGSEISIPGYMVWIALIYAVAGSYLTHKIGRPLIGLNFNQQRFEADFRFSLVRLRENSEGIALYGGEQGEQAGLLATFGRVWLNWWALMKYQKRLTWFTAGYGQIAIIFPILVAAPRYFASVIQMGELMQTSSAFGQVQGALSWFIDAYTQLAEWKASVERLTGFHRAIQEARQQAHSGQGIAVVANDGETLAVRDLDLALPDGRLLLKNANFSLSAGERVLLAGPSGSGKSTLIRAVAGIWPFGKGRVDRPAEGRVLFLPQKPYLPIGSLRTAVSYPATGGTFDDGALVEALRDCRLEHFGDQLDEVRPWAQAMSPGEQQRLAFARALLHKPAWLFLDEATSALDEATERHLYGLILDRLPETTLLSIAHRPAVAVHHERQLSLVAGGGHMRLIAGVETAAALG
jgi:putative ATP-binding cassette transporter